MYKAVKVVITTERSILDGVAEIIESHGASGYTYVDAGGKGSRGKRQLHQSHHSILANVKIEAIVADHATAEAITEAVVAAFFGDYSGIAYVEDVEILRPGNFNLHVSDGKNDLG